MEPLKIATVQFETRDNDKVYNLSVIREMCRKASVEGADVVAFHECSVCGYTFAKDLSREELFGNTNDIEERIYDNMENVFVRDLLPVDERFDMNMHILSFAPGGCHPFVETHVQEHGAYLYEGEGLYLLNDDWVPVKAEDFIWMGAYCKQCCYGVGLTRLSYIYSKDCHRDAEI